MKIDPTDFEKKNKPHRAELIRFEPVFDSIQVNFFKILTPISVKFLEQNWTELDNKHLWVWFN